MPSEKKEGGKTSELSPIELRHQKIKEIAESIYIERLEQNRSGTAQDDWRQAETRYNQQHRKLYRGILKRGAPIWEVAWWPFDLCFNKLFQLNAIKVLAIPIALALFGTWASQRFQAEANQNQILEDYFNQLEKLVLDADLREEEPKSGVTILARGRTVTALSELDLKRKNQLLAFLRASQLTEANEKNGDEAIISFQEQDLSSIDLTETNFRGLHLNGAEIRGGTLKGANFSDADLRNADLSAANLNSADLRNADLRNANLSGAYFEEADFNNADLRDADFRDADLSGAYFNDANLRDAVLNDANLSGAYFEEADLSGAYFYNADLSRADLWEADLSDANLWEADLSDANLSDANLSDANLSFANFSFANLREADLSDADLSDADLSDADLSDADLRSADLRSADLSGAYFSNADLTGADLTGADLTGADLSRAILLAANLRQTSNLRPEQLTGEAQPYLCNTALPDYIDNRDCDVLSQILTERYFDFLEDGIDLVDEARAKEWEE